MPIWKIPNAARRQGRAGKSAFGNPKRSTMRTQVMTQPAVATPWLESAQAGEPAERTLLASFPFNVGRIESADLCIDSTRVSREHAVITRHGKKYHVHDLGSTNGTFLNGQRVEEAILGDGDQIMFADFEFTFYCGSPSAERDVVTQVIPPGHAAGEDAVRQTIGAVRRIHEVVTRRGLRMVFQPIVQLETGVSYGFEALGTSGPNEPAQPRCEQWTGGIECRAAGRLRRLFRRLAAEEAAGLPEGRLFVALAASECDDLSVVDHFCQLRELVGGNRQLVVEIPDTAVHDSSEFRELRTALRTAKIEVAYDGYAAGKTHVAEHKDFAPDYLKLASTLLRSLGRGHDRQRQVKLMVSASHDIGTSVIATGVENEADLQVAHDMKCALAQGDLFGRPQSAGELADKPAAHHPQPSAV
jgi:EAL domain-containing protein (putative c-di-GMP-specific phosphodiesterase class I)